MPDRVTSLPSESLKVPDHEGTDHARPIIIAIAQMYFLKLVILIFEKFAIQLKIFNLNHTFKILPLPPHKGDKLRPDGDSVPLSEGAGGGIVNIEVSGLSNI
jgi:hypothetical protein